MLDKTKVYIRYPVGCKNPQPSANLRRVKILFEDEISFYVESLVCEDAAGRGTRYSMKKHCFFLKAEQTLAEYLERKIVSFTIHLRPLPGCPAACAIQTWIDEFNSMGNSDV